jgi:hypothetical protein
MSFHSPTSPLFILASDPNDDPVNAERQQGRGVKLELGSAGANAFFFGRQIMEGPEQLSRNATARNPTAPLLDPESLVAELDAEAERPATNQKNSGDRG